MRWATIALLLLLVTACGTAAPPAPIVTAIAAEPSPAGVATGKAALKGSSAVNASRACMAITSAQRKSAILGHKVDLIADPTTIVCDRLAWADFSTPYLVAHQRVLVPSTSEVRGIGDLGGQKVCAAAGTTSIHEIAVQPSHPIPVAVPPCCERPALLCAAGARAGHDWRKRLH